MLAQLATENGIEGIDLMLGIYRMNEANTRGVGQVLQQYGLSFLPEAHNYLCFEEKRFDFTKPSSKHLSFAASLEEEIIILPHQITDFKVQYHRNFLEKWLGKNASTIQYSLTEIWEIREACIKAISE